MDDLRLPDDMATALIDHAQAEYPKEACGIIGGPPGEAGKLYRLTNVDPDPIMRYNADPKELKRVTDDIYDHDWDVVAIYHSHTHSPAFPSATDVERAFYPEASYVLVSLMDRQKPDLRAFRIIEGKITEIGVVRDGKESA
ncbi:MAG: M67 family metallopeptidase [Actinobacteria bacterium]|nr:MAG: M67 family metallopeptidase [Actinomycetota bacterium]